MTDTADEVSAAAISRARALIELRRFDDAVAALRPVVGQQSADQLPWCLMSQAQLGCGEWELALTAARTACSLAPAEEWPQRLASVALAKLGRPRESLAAAREAVRLGPYTWQAYARLARELILAGNANQEAWDAVQRCAALAPHEAEPQVLFGMIAAAHGDRAAAEAAFHRALSLDPESSAAHTELARLGMGGMFSGGPTSLADAAGGFADALRVNPSSTAARANLDIALQVFLGRVSYPIFLDAFLLGRLVTGSVGLPIRLIPVAVLAIPGVFAVLFVRGLRPALRGYLARMITHPWLRAAVLLDVAAALLMASAAFSPKGARVPQFLFAAAAAAVSRLLLIVATRRVARSARAGRATRDPRRPYGS